MPGMLEHAQGSRQDVSAIGRDIAAIVIVKTSTGFQAELALGHLSATMVGVA